MAVCRCRLRNISGDARPLVGSVNPEQARRGLGSIILGPVTDVEEAIDRIHTYVRRIYEAHLFAADGFNSTGRGPLLDRRTV